MVPDESNNNLWAEKGISQVTIKKSETQWRGGGHEGINVASRVVRVRSRQRLLGRPNIRIDPKRNSKKRNLFFFSIIFVGYIVYSKSYIRIRIPFSFPQG